MNIKEMFSLSKGVYDPKTPMENNISTLKQLTKFIQRQGGGKNFPP